MSPGANVYESWVSVFVLLDTIGVLVDGWDVPFFVHCCDGDCVVQFRSDLTFDCFAKGAF